MGWGTHSIALDWAPLRPAIWCHACLGVTLIGASAQTTDLSFSTTDKPANDALQLWAEHLILQGAQSTTMLGLGYGL